MVIPWETWEERYVYHVFNILPYLLAYSCLRQCLRSGTIYFDRALARSELYNDPTLQAHCKGGCFCIDDEDKYLAEDLGEAAKRRGIAPALPWPRVTSSARPPPMKPPQAAGTNRPNSQAQNWKLPHRKITPSLDNPTAGLPLQMYRQAINRHVL